MQAVERGLRAAASAVPLAIAVRDVYLVDDGITGRSDEQWLFQSP